MTTTESSIASVSGAVPIVLGPSAIDGLGWKPLTELGNVRVKVLHRSGDCVAGLLRLEPGSAERLHTHIAAHHHAWVLQGEATIAGTRVRAGSYFHVPAGAQHAITGAGPEGCEIFYLFQPGSEVTGDTPAGESEARSAT